ncbi:uncharacterized protein F4812DRAFT_42455 [Daldinia caldariorum]|uniref:uncharacterized protein n=1 Tax=Daldinia caldariorum TaxID=326644 RepID=UPI002007A824|nr:uncharacterized protein F4812DRAFT_42455 [Daldinia caldariorum]KAI1473202.1 hypothetical protein F4812DRAFT_42455 [Daldinia caldariorum]
MVGVPRSKRCERCKRIKIKCDENWPTCTPCLRAGVTCSGPPNLIKFIHTSSYTSTTGEARHDDGVATQLIARGRSAASLESIRQRGLPGGASFGHFRLAPGGPRNNPTTVADRVAARLVGYLTHENATWDILSSFGYVKHLPVRLNESPALRDCVALMCSTWVNARRDFSSAQLIDSSLYGKALRTLQRAINDHEQQLSNETLAAATILERLELVFDSQRPYHRSRHWEGIQTLMIRRGPPNPQDNFAVHLAFENHAALISHWVVEGGENFYLSSPWKEAMEESFLAMDASVSSEQADYYGVGHYYGHWPSLVQGFQLVLSDADANSQQVQALALYDKTARLDADIACIGEPAMLKFRRSGRILEESDRDSPIGVKFHFGNLQTMSVLISYVMIRTVFNRILYHLTVMLNQPDMSLEVEHRELCRKMWMCIPFFRSLGAVTTVIFAPQLYLSYEGASENEKEYLLDFIMELVSYRGSARYPRDRRTVERFVLDAAQAMVGRRPFVTSISSSQREAAQVETTGS